MRNFVIVILVTAWGLWLGGMIALLLFVTQLFSSSPPVAIEAAPVLFRTFATYQLFVGMIACGSGTLLALLSRRSVHAAMTLLMIVALTAGLLIHGWTNRMENLRHAGQSSNDEFKQLHAKSSIAYTTEVGLLLVAGIGLTLTLPRAQKDRGTAGE